MRRQSDRVKRQSDRMKRQSDRHELLLVVYRFDTLTVSRMV
jgi:hypothetical protein